MDPYPLYHRLRNLAPVHRSEAAGAWMLTRYDDCQAILRDPRVIRGYAGFQDATHPGWRDRHAFTRMETSMLMLDGPAHTRLRRLVTRAFTPRTIERLRPRIEALVDQLLDPIAQAGGGDLMVELAFPFPVEVIAALLGVPLSDCPPFRDRALRLTAMFELDATDAQLDAADQAHLESDAYFDELIERKRARPGADLLSDLLAVEEGDDRLAADELSNLAILLFLAGFETTTNLIGNATLGFIAHPDQFDLLGRRPELLSRLPDELLRYDSTVQMVFRLTADEVELDGALIPPGEAVLAVVGAGNRDPAHFTDPDRLDVARADVRPLTFGGGVHFCLGAALARLETEIVFTKLVERFGAVEAAGDAPYRDRLTLRGPTTLPVTFHPRKAVDVASTRVRPARGDDRAWRDELRTRIERSRPMSPADVADIARLLGRVEFFAGCETGELETLAATAYPIAFDTGDLICAEGAEAAECYVIAEGEADIRIDSRRTATVGYDDVVGERGPLLGDRRSATVVAASHLSTYAISRRRLTEVIEANPKAAMVMREFVQSRQPVAS